jgi:hypothetical protein
MSALLINNPHFEKDTGLECGSNNHLTNKAKVKIEKTIKIQLLYSNLLK